MDIKDNYYHKKIIYIIETKIIIDTFLHYFTLFCEFNIVLFKYLMHFCREIAKSNIC